MDVEETVSEVPVEDRPSSIHIDDPLLPRGPWSFWKEALPGGFGPWGVLFILGWIAFLGLSSAAWASHLQRFTGSSSLPNYWGELLTARDVWEMLENGGLRASPFGFWTPVAAVLCLLWILWSGWKLQARSVNLPARLGPWFWGFTDALILALVPMGLASWILTGFLYWLAATGIQSLAWLYWVGGVLIRLACVSTFLLQWWLCRINRAGHEAQGWRMGSLGTFVQHLGHSFLRLWLHPIQWGTLVLGGVIFRVGMPFLVLALAWRWGGGTTARVWSFWLLLVSVTAFNAWLIGWFMRLVSLFWRLDREVRAEVFRLKQRSRGIPAPSSDQ